MNTEKHGDCGESAGLVRDCSRAAGCHPAWLPIEVRMRAAAVGDNELFASYFRDATNP